MLDRQKALTLLHARRDAGSLFSVLPDELILIICNYNYNPNPQSKIGLALHHAAYARKEDVEALLALLNHDPNLLLQAGDVIAPSGDLIKRVTIYEFILGAGDYDLKRQIEKYFSKIKNGEKERVFQYEKYRPHIEGILAQKPYDVTHLFKLIKAASDDDVTAMLNKNIASVKNKELHDAMIKFRKDWAPKTITEPCMHYNYQSLYHVYDLLDKEVKHLRLTGGIIGSDKLQFVWRLLAGFELRRLPGFDRCLIMQGIYYALVESHALRRSYRSNVAGDFPITLTDDCLDGLGSDFSFNIQSGGGGRGQWSDNDMAGSAEYLMLTKVSTLTGKSFNALCTQHQLSTATDKQQQSQCVMF